MCGLRHQNGGQIPVCKALILTKESLGLGGISEYRLFSLEAAEKSHHLGVVGGAQHRQKAVVLPCFPAGGLVGLVMLGADAVDLLDEGAGAVHEGKGGVFA